MAATLTAASLRRGDQVQIRFGHSLVRGIITEERGPIGAGGRELYTVEFEFGEGELYQIELPAESIKKVEGVPVAWSAAS